MGQQAPAGDSRAVPGRLRVRWSTSTPPESPYVRYLYGSLETLPVGEMLIWSPVGDGLEPSLNQSGDIFAPPPPPYRCVTLMCVCVCDVLEATAAALVLTAIFVVFCAPSLKRRGPRRRGPPPGVDRVRDVYFSVRVPVDVGVRYDR